jgi:hypothetical protein
MPCMTRNWTRSIRRPHSALWAPTGCSGPTLFGNAGRDMMTSPGTRRFPPAHLRAKKALRTAAAQGDSARAYFLAYLQGEHPSLVSVAKLCKGRRDQALEGPQRVAGGASPGIGYCIRMSPAEAKVGFCQALSVAPLGLYTIIRPNPGLRFACPGLLSLRPFRVQARVSRQKPAWRAFPVGSPPTVLPQRHRRL